MKNERRGNSSSPVGARQNINYRGAELRSLQVGDTSPLGTGHGFQQHPWSGTGCLGAPRQRPSSGASRS